MKNANVQDVSLDCVQRLSAMLNLNLPPISEITVRSLFEYAYYQGNRDGFREAIEIAKEESQPGEWR